MKPVKLSTNTSQFSRRACLQVIGLRALSLLGITSVCQAHATAPAGQANSALATGTTRFAACWDDAKGAHHAGWLQLTPQAGVRVLHATELPTRGHGLALLPDGALLVVARRPGDWLLRLSPGKKPQWLWQEPGRVFGGHVHVVPDGKTLFTTEIDTDSGQGLLGVRHASGMQKRAEFITNGHDPHAVLALPAINSGSIKGQMSARSSPSASHNGLAGHPLSGMLFVANGGIDTAPETGRQKRQLQQMDSSIVCLHPDTGELMGQWRLTDPRLSLRHLAWAGAGATPRGGDASAAMSSSPTLGIALQAEHDDAAQRASSPLLAVLSWDEQPEGELRVAQGQPSLAGYGGDVAVLGDGTAAQFVVSATRGDVLARYDLRGGFLGTTALAQAGALASTASDLWAGGRIGMGHLQATAQATNDCQLAPWPGGRLDNHCLRVAASLRPECAFEFVGESYEKSY